MSVTLMQSEHSPRSQFARVAGRRCAGVVLIAQLLCTSAQAAEHQADPANLEQLIRGARGGDRIHLAPGDYGPLQIEGMSFEPALSIHARGARFAGLSFKHVGGVIIRGGTFSLPAAKRNSRTGKEVYGSALRFEKSQRIEIEGGTFLGVANISREAGVLGQGYGVLVVETNQVRIAKSRFRGFRTGVAFGRVADFQIVDNTFDSMRSDGFQAGESRRGLIEGNRCSGTAISGDEHPDCIQLWSRPTSPPTSDIVIRGNTAEGNTQGIGLFDHVRQGVPDGGYDRILIEDNTVVSSQPQGIGLMNARNSIVRRNRVATIPGSRFRTSINVGSEVKRCGNEVAAGAGKVGVKDPPC